MVQEVKIVISADDDASAVLKNVAAQLDGVGDQAAIASQQIGRINTATPKMNHSMRMASMQLSQVAQQTMVTGNFINALAIQLPDLALGFGAMGIAAGVAGGVLLQMAGTFLEAGDEAKGFEDALDAVSNISKDLRSNIDLLQLSTEELVATYGEGATRVREFALVLAELRAQQAQSRLGETVDLLGDTISGFRTAQDAGRDYRNTLARIEKQFELSNQQARTFEGLLDDISTAGTFDDQQAALENILRFLEANNVEASKIPPELQDALAEMIEFSNETDRARELMRQLAGEAAGVTVGVPLFNQGFDDLTAPPPGSGGRKRGGGGGSRRDPLADLERRLERLQESLLTEEELMIAHYERDQLLLDESLQKKLLLEEEYANASALLAANHAKELADLQKRGKDIEMRNLSSAFGQLEGALSSHNEKLFRIAQIAGAAQALISTYQGAAEALKLPFPANLAAAATVMAKGLSFVSAIKAASSSGGGVGGFSGGGSAAAAPAQAVASQAPLEARISGLDPNSIFSGSSITSLFDALQDEAGDRGLSVSFAQ